MVERAQLLERIPHDQRRTAVRNLERASVPLSVAMQLTGHKTESAYRRYAIVSEADLARGFRSWPAPCRGGRQGDNRGSSSMRRMRKANGGRGIRTPTGFAPSGFQDRRLTNLGLALPEGKLDRWGPAAQRPQEQGALPPLPCAPYGRATMPGKRRASRQSHPGFSLARPVCNEGLPGGTHAATDHPRHPGARGDADPGG